MAVPARAAHLLLYHRARLPEHLQLPNYWGGYVPGVDYGIGADLRYYLRRDRPLDRLCDGHGVSCRGPGHEPHGGRVPLFVVVLAGAAAGLGIGLIPGLINGLIIARLRVPSFIVTLGMYGIARGAGFILSGGQPVSIQTNGVGQVGNAYLLYLLPDGRVSFFHLPSNLQGVRPSQIVQLLPFPLIFLVVVVLICAWLLWQTRFGRHTYAVGGSEEASRRAGVPVVRHTILIYVLSAFMASLAGVVYTLRFSNGAADVGDPLLLTSIAAVIIGGASLLGGEGTIIGTVIGALIIAIIQNGLIFLGINPFWQFIAVGTVIILAVLVDQTKKRLV